jgi:hypothetical protein
MLFYIVLFTECLLLIIKLVECSYLKKNNIEISELSFGFGKKLYFKLHKGIKYSLNLFPFWGEIEAIGYRILGNKEHEAGYGFNQITLLSKIELLIWQFLLPAIFLSRMPFIYISKIINYLGVEIDPMKLFIIFPEHDSLFFVAVTSCSVLLYFGIIRFVLFLAFNYIQSEMKFYFKFVFDYIITIVLFLISVSIFTKFILLMRVFFTFNDVCINLIYGIIGHIFFCVVAAFGFEIYFKITNKTHITK